MRLLTLLSLFFLGFISSLCAEANWYLIGGLRGELETFFENHPEVELIWGFEEGTAKWASKKESIESKLSQFTKLEQLDECGGYWVLSTKRPEYFPFNQCTYAELVYPGFKLLKGNGTSVKSFLTENPEVDMIWSYTDPTPTSYRPQSDQDDLSKVRVDNPWRSAASDSRGRDTKFPTLEFLEAGKAYWMVSSAQSTLLKSALIAREKHTSNLVGSKVYHFGGSNGIQTLNTMEIFDIERGESTIASPSTTARIDHSATVYEKEIYIFGGRSGEQLYLNSLVKYDPASDSWIDLQQAPKGRRLHQAFIYQDSIYVWGGYSENSLENLDNSMDVYSIKDNSWSKVQPPKGGVARIGHAAVVLDDIAYMIGGTDQSIDRYHLTSSIWLDRLPLNQHFSRGTATVYNGSILLAGGVDGSFQAQKRLRSLDLSSGQFLDLGDLLVDRQLQTSVLYQDKLYSFGGRNRNLEVLASSEIFLLREPRERLENAAPILTNLEIFGNSGHIVMRFDLEEPDGDVPVNLYPRFSLDGGQSWSNFSKFEGEFKAIQAGQSREISWDSSQDISLDQTGVKIQIKASDGHQSSTSSATTDIWNGLPEVKDLSLLGKSADVEISFQLIDPDEDELNLEIEFSVDEGSSWSPITIKSGSISQLESSTNSKDPIKGVISILWDSLADIKQERLRVLLRLIPQDFKASQSTKTRIAPSLKSSIFSIFNGPNHPAEIESVILEGNSGLISLEIQAFDLDEDLVTVHLEYSLDGLNWKEATLRSGANIEFNPSQPILLSWESTKDITGDENVALRLKVEDGKLGTPKTFLPSEFSLFNANEPPQIEDLAIEEKQDGLLSIYGILIDHEKDTIDLEFQYRLPQSIDWKPIPPFHIEGARFALSSNESFRLTWYPELSTELRFDALEIKIIANDSKESSIHTTTIKLTNLLGGDWSSGPFSTSARARHIGRDGLGKILYFGGENSSVSTLLKNEMLTISSKRFSPLAQFPEQLVDTAGEIWGDIFYFFSGRTNSVTRQLNDELRLQNLQTGTSTSIAISTVVSRFGHQSLVEDGLIYFTGGMQQDGQILDETLILNTKNLNTDDPRFITGTSMQLGRVGHCFKKIGKQYVAWGGAIQSDDGLKVTPQLEIFDPAKQNWHFGTPSPRPGLFSSCVVRESTGVARMYVLGGLLDSTEDKLNFANDVLIYDLSTDSWSFAEPNLTKRSSASLNFSTDTGQIYLFGGYQSATTAFSSMEIYNPPSVPSHALSTYTLIKNLVVDGTSEEMELFFDVEDQPGSALDLLIELSVDMGVTWNRLGSESLTGSLTGIAPSTGIKLLWDSTLEINEDNHDVRLRVSAINRRGGLFLPAVSDKISVLNDPSNSPTTISNMKLFAENSEGLSFRDKIEITYDLEDLDGDLSSISLEYSTDGGSNWIQTNNLVGETSALSSGLSKKLTWNSLEDIQHTTSVLIRLIADDGRRGASNTVSECFELCNGNFLPYAQGVRLVGDQDDITISFELVDQDGDSMDIHFEFSVDQATWMTSDEISGPTSGLATGFHEIIWHSLRDLPRNESAVRVRILPSDTGVGFAGISSTNSVLNENYLALISIERARYSHSANIYDNRIFYWGGLSQDGQLLNSLEIFDLNTFTWSRGASGGTPRREHVGIAHSGKLYFWGGRSGTGATINSMDIYDINGDSWSEGLTGGRARRGHSAVVFENKIYFWGGQTSSSELNSMDIYDLEKDSWLEGDSGGTARAEHTGARVGDSIYFWGGLSGQVILDTMDIFNLKTGEWTRGVTGGRARFSHSAVEFEGKIYFYGGFGETGLSDTLDIFDTQSQIWLEGDPGGVGRREHSAIEHQGDIYYFGGVHEAEVINLYETYTINAVSNNSSSNTSNALGWKELSFEVSSGNSHAGIVEDDKIYHYFQNKVDQGSAVEIIDPRTGIREQSIPLTLPISGFATAKSYGRHYFFGGIDSSGNTTDALFIFDTNTKKLVLGPPGGIPRYGHMAGFYRENIYLFGGRDEFENFAIELDIFQPVTGKWLQIKGGGSPRIDGTSQSLDGRIYFWGGVNSSGLVTNSLEIYDAQAGVFLKGTPGGTPRKKHSSVILNGNIYHWAGMNQHGDLLNTVDVYSIDNDSWSTAPAGGSERYSPLSVNLSGRIYAFGGQDDLGALSDSYEFIPEIKTGVSWQRGLGGGIQRAEHSSVEFQERLFQWGGRNESGGSNITDIYDVKTNTWSEGSVGGRTRWNHSSLVHNGKAYYFGGQDRSGVATNSLDVYLLPGRQLGWIEGPIGPKGRTGAVAGAIDNRLYFFGGASEDGSLSKIVETFDTVSNRWLDSTTPTGDFTVKELSSSVIIGSKMLIFGGRNGDSVSDDLFEFDLIEQDIQRGLSAGSGNERYSHQALAHDQKMYVLGGLDEFDRLLDTITVYSNRSGWSELPTTLSTGLANFSALLHADKIYIFGGKTASGVTDKLEILDLNSFSISQADSAPNARFGHSGAIVGSRMFFWGGSNKDGPLETMDLYDLVSKKWVEGVPYSPELMHSAAVANSKRIYSWGGSDLSENVSSRFEIFLPEALEISSEAGAFSEEISGGTSRTFSAGESYQHKLYFHGGEESDSGEPTSRLDIFDSFLEVWSVSSPSTIRRKGHSMNLADDLLFVWGGEDQNGQVNNFLEIYDPLSNSWSMAPSGGTSRAYFASEKIGNHIYFFGGISTSGQPLTSMDIYTVNPWEEGNPGGTSRYSNSGAELGGKLFYFGGLDSRGRALNSLDVYDPVANTWQLGKEVERERYGHTASVVDGSIYYFGGQNDEEGLVKQIDYFDGLDWGVDLVWETPRYEHSASVLNGKIYIWGGKNTSHTVINSMEIFEKDSKDSDGTAGGTARFGHTATVYGDKIYFYGGTISEGQINIMDIYDVTQDQWSVGQQGGTERAAHTATLVDGKIYYIGGFNASGRITNVDIYDIDQNRWLKGYESPLGRSDHVSLLAGGSLYVWGGTNPSDSAINIQDIYRVNQWRSGSLPGVTRSHLSASSSDEKLFIWGGEDADGNLLNNLYIYETASDRWIEGLSGGVARKHHSANESNGKIFFFGGEDQSGKSINSIDIYDISASSWSTGFSGGSSRQSHVGVVLDSKFFFWGGMNESGQFLNTMDGFIPTSISAREWLEGEDGLQSRYGHSSVEFKGKIYIFGGKDESGSTLNTLHIYDIEKNTWAVQDTDGVSTKRHNHSASLWAGKMIVWGGIDESGDILGELEVYDFNEGTWTSLATNPEGNPRAGHNAHIYDGKMYIWGGRDVAGSLNTVDIYDIESKSWSQGNSGGRSRISYSSAMRDGMVFFHGGRGSGNLFFNSMDILDLRVQSNQPPTISNLQLSDNSQGFRYQDQVEFTMDLGDFDGDPMSVGVEYSVDLGLTWFQIDPSHLTGQLSNLDSALDHKITWNSFSDIQEPVEDVLLRVSSTDGEDRGQQLVSPPFNLNNAGTWVVGSNSPRARSNHSLAIASTGAKDLLVAWGGFDQNGDVGNTLEIYNLTDNTWTSATPGPSEGAGRVDHDVVTLDNRIFHYGGKNTLGALNNFAVVEFSEEGTFTWVGYEPPREGEARYLHSCSLVGRKMYVWGGKGRTGLVRQMDIYDFDTETWTTGVADGIARYAHVAIPAGELIYYFGGRGIDSDEDGSDDYLDSLEIYNTVKNLWIQGPSLGIPLESAAASFVRDRIYVYGGTRNGDFFNNELYIYNIGSGIWRKGLSGGLSRRNSRGVAFNNKLYFHGGFNGEIVDQLDWFEIPGP